MLVATLALVAAACAGEGGGDVAQTTVAGGADTTALVGAETTTTAGETTTSAAGDTTTAGAAGGDVRVGMAYDIGGRGDQSFNDAAARGLDQAKEEFGIEAEELEPEAGGENREENLRLLAEAGFSPVFAIGFAFQEGVDTAAVDFPDTSFGIIDAVVEQPNVASLVFAEHQGSFLVGAAAALKTQTDTIGFIGGVEVPLIERFQAGYEAGARHINPDIEILVTYLTQPPDFSGFNDPAKGREAALAMYQQGADIVYHAAGGSGGGLFEAAREVSESTGTQQWAIGVDSDQYQQVGEELKPYILTSMLKRVDVAVFETIADFVEGNFQPEVRVFDLEADGVGYATSGGFIDDITDQLDELKQQIVAGEIEVPETPQG